MNRNWAEANQATRPVDRRKGIENAASFRSNGTGPFRVRERQPSARTVLRRSPSWWNKFETNLDEVVFLPIENSSTRVAALLSGEVDVIDPVLLQDIPRVNSSSKLRVVENPELRVIFLGFDQKRDVLPNSSVTDRNPFKDKRVRQAFYQAIDIQSIKTQIMRNASLPTGAMLARGIQGFAPELKARLPLDQNASRKLLAEAGYPNGFEVGMNCPNDRYTSKTQSELDQGKRNAMIKQALDLHAEDVGHIPLHQQTLSWGMKRNIVAYQRVDGFMLFKWMNVR